MTLASRLTGFLRDILMAAVLGSGAVADAYFAAFLLPNLFRRVLSEGAFNAAFVPIYNRRLAERGEAGVAAFSEAALSSLVALVLATVLVAELAMPRIMTAIAPGFHTQPEKLADAVQFSRIAFVFVGAIIVVALLSSLLNAIGRYGLVAASPLILNLLLIPVLLVLLLLDWRGEQRAGLVLVVAVLAAGLLQLAYVARGIRRSGTKVSLSWPRPDKDVGLMLMLILPGLVLAGAGHFNMVVAAQLSSAMPSAVSWLYYADRIFQLPLGFVAAAIGVVLLPEVSRAYQEHDRDRAQHAGNRALEFGLLLILPAMLALIILAGPIIDVIYRHGAFTPADSAAVADILRAIACGLPGFVLVKVFLPPYLAREAMRVPLAAALAGIAVNIVVTLALMPSLAHVAAPLGVAASAWVNAIVLGIGLRINRIFNLDSGARHVLPRTFLCAASTGALTYALLELARPLLAPDQALGIRALMLGLICLIGFAGHGAAVHVFGAADLRGLRAALGRKPVA